MRESEVAAAGREPRSPKTLVMGWFSFEGMRATAGDLLARDVVCGWLDESGRRWDMAVASPFDGGPHWLAVDPSAYSSVVFVCGPMAESPITSEVVRRFRHCRLVGVDLSMLEPLDAWNPFDALFERDSSERVRPDVSFLATPRPVPVVGRVLVHPQPMYGSRALHPKANALIASLVASSEMAVVDIDTGLEDNAGGLRTAAEVESLIARMDVVVTTRLHGAVLALKNGVPPVALDPIAGGAKVLRQVEALGWPVALEVATASEAQLREGFDFCLTSEARRLARRTRRRAVADLAAVRDGFMELMASPDRPGTDRIEPAAPPAPPEPSPAPPRKEGGPLRRLLRGGATARRPRRGRRPPEP